MYNSTKKSEDFDSDLTSKTLNLTQKTKIIREREREREAHVIPFPPFIGSDQLISATAAVRTRRSRTTI